MTDRISPAVSEVVGEALSTPPVGLVLMVCSIRSEHGHPADPNSVDREIVATLTEQTEPTDVIIETGLHDRAIVRAGLTAPAEAEGLAYRLHGALSARLLNGQERVCEVAIGVAVGRTGDTAADLLRFAGHALGDAQVLGGNTVVVFDDEDRDLLGP